MSVRFLSQDGVFALLERFKLGEKCKIGLPEHFSDHSVETSAWYGPTVKYLLGVSPTENDQFSSIPTPYKQKTITRGCDGYI